MRSIQNIQELTGRERSTINGGGFAYDLGFAIRFIVKTGPNAGGATTAIADFLENYRPR